MFKSMLFFKAIKHKKEIKVVTLNEQKKNFLFNNNRLFMSATKSNKNNAKKIK